MTKLLSIGTVRVKQEEETDTRIMQENRKKSGRKKHGHKGRKVPKKNVTSTMDLLLSSLRNAQLTTLTYSLIYGPWPEGIIPTKKTY